MVRRRSRDVTPIDRRNLPWRAGTVVWGGGPRPFPAAADVRERLVALGSRPEAREAALLRELDPVLGLRHVVSEKDWPGFARALVRDADGPAWPVPGPVPGADPGDDPMPGLVARERADPIGTLPFRLTLGPDWTTFQFNHALGDSSALWPAFLAMIHPEDWFDLFPLDPPQGWTPLRRALQETFGHGGWRTRDLPGTLRAPRPALPVTSTGEPQPPPRPLVALGRSQPGFRKRLREAAPAPDLGIPALMTARAHVVARRLGLATHPGIALVVDCRRYLAGDDYVEGNFVAGTYLPFADPTDPVQVDASFQHHLESGRPLLTMAASGLLSRRGPQPEERTTPDPDGRSLLSLSHVGRLPWPPGPGGPDTMMATVRGVGDRGIALLIVESSRSMTVSVTWAEGHQDPALMQRFARDLAGEDD